MKLNNDELLKIEGGAIKYLALLGLGGLIAFLTGIIDDYLNPQKCN